MWYVEMRNAYTLIGREEERDYLEERDVKAGQF
jgi:hypothetical protein